MAKIFKGDVIRITGSVLANGVIWWTSPGKEPVRAATVSAGQAVMLGPYIGDATYRIDMQQGAYTIENLGKSNNIAPVPLADFIETGGGGGSEIPEGGTVGQCLKRGKDDSLVWSNDLNTTYSVLSEAEAVAGVASTARAISAVRLKETIKSFGIPSNGGITAVVAISQAAYDALPVKIATTLYVITG